MQLRTARRASVGLDACRVVSHRLAPYPLKPHTDPSSHLVVTSHPLMFPSSLWFINSSQLVWILFAASKFPYDVGVVILEGSFLCVYLALAAFDSLQGQSSRSASGKLVTCIYTVREDGLAFTLYSTYDTDQLAPSLSLKPLIDHPPVLTNALIIKKSSTSFSSQATKAIGRIP